MQYTIWLTEKCNMRCKYCYENIDKKDSIDNLSIDTAKQILRYLNDKDIDTIRFHGGEPFYNYEVFEYLVVEFVKQNKNIKFQLTTNGTIWNDNIKALILKYKNNFNYGISISIDGKEEIHNLNRRYISGEGTLKEVKVTIRDLVDNIDGLIGRMTVTPDTVGNMWESVQYIHSLGIDTISHALDMYDERWDNDLLKIVTEQYDKIIKFYKDKEDINVSFVDEVKDNRTKGRCSFSHNIAVDGKIYPCIDAVGVSEFVLGDIFTDTKISLESEYSLLDILKKDNEFCLECSRKDMCIGNRCKFFNKTINGDWYKPVPLICALENVKMKVGIANGLIHIR